MSEHPRKIGTMKEVDAATGEIVREKKNAFTMLPPPPDKCQECASEHNYNEPHNQQSLYYQYRFYGTHGRFPTWSDAMSHCTPEVKALWRQKLVEMLTKNGLPVPDDLKGAPEGNR